MLVAGAKRHAVEILDLLIQAGNTSDLCFFDDVSLMESDLFCGQYPILKNLDQARLFFAKKPVFILGLGGVKARRILANKLQQAGGELQSIIASTAVVGQFDVFLGAGLNIMHAVLVSSRVSVGTGTLLNAFSSIHHDVVIGDFCEISPRATLLGGVQIGNMTSVGASATILPDITIGDNVIVGAGAVVTKNIPSNVLVTGVPARVIKQLPELNF